MLSHQIYSVLAGGPNTGTVTETTQEKHTWESVKPTVPVIANIFIVPSLGIQSPKLRMVMEPKCYPEEVIGHPNHPLTRCLDP